MPRVPARLLISVLDLVFPPSCAACATYMRTSEQGRLCGECLQSIHTIDSPLCTVCGRPFPGRRGPNHVCGKCLVAAPPFATARSVFAYQGTTKKLIQRMKFRADGYALKTLCSLVKAVLPPDFSGPELVVPVPLHPRRLRERGFNQSVSLARGIFPSSPIALNSIKRIRDTRSQAGLPAKDRLNNVKDAFTLARPLPRSVMRATILDDVFTTGATVSACAKTLLKGGIQAVDVFTIARTVRH